MKKTLLFIIALFYFNLNCSDLNKIFNAYKEIIIASSTKIKVDIIIDFAKKDLSLNDQKIQKYNINKDKSQIFIYLLDEINRKVINANDQMSIFFFFKYLEKLIYVIPQEIYFNYSKFAFIVAIKKKNFDLAKKLKKFNKEFFKDRCQEYLNKEFFEKDCQDFLNKELYNIFDTKDFPLVQNLIDLGANVNVNFDGRSVLNWAIYCDNVNVVEILIKNGAEIQNQNLLILATIWARKKEKKDGEAEDSRIVELLIKNGININEKNEKGETPFYCLIMRMINVCEHINFFCCQVLYLYLLHGNIESKEPKNYQMFLNLKNGLYNLRGNKKLLIFMFNYIFDQAMDSKQRLKDVAEVINNEIALSTKFQPNIINIISEYANLNNSICEYANLNTFSPYEKQISK